jgi:Na+/H+ antiporter NhaD/arsenite permease-like protein
MDFAAVLAAVLALGAVVTKSVDLVRNVIDRDDSLPPATWNVAAFLIGIIYCVGWQIDLSAAILALVPALAEQSSRLTGVAGQVLTGVLAGGAAGFAHELFDNLSAGAYKKRAEAEAAGTKTFSG